MEKRLFLVFCVLNLIAVIYSKTEDDADDKNYDLNGLIRKNIDRYENSLRAKRNDFLHQFKFEGIDDEFQFEPSDLLLFAPKCLRDIMHILKNIKSSWAMKLFDSFGKPESGILQGNMRWLGDYNECINITSVNPNSTSGNFRGKYCSASLGIQIPGGQNLPVGFSIAVCIPDSCSPDELKEDVSQLLRIAGTLPGLNSNRSSLNGNGSLPMNVTLQCKPTERHLNGAAKSIIALLSIFFAFTVIGSSITAFKYFMNVVEGYKNTLLLSSIVDSSQLIGDQDNTVMKKENDDTSLQADSSVGNKAGGTLDGLEAFFKCFCVFTNGSKILNTNTSEGELLCVHGIRFLSMCWVILGHAYLFGIMQMRNILALMDYVDTFFFQIVLQGFYSVDSFFVLSGFLLAYLSMNQFSKSNGRIPWLYFYIHRYIRLTPIYMILLEFSATVYLYMGSGPFWPDQDIDPNCQKHWWQNLLYINNFYDQANQCMGWAWYLANDMQFFVISPLFLITLWRWPKVGYSLLAVFMLACWVSNFYITYHYGLMAGVFNVSQAATASLIKFMDYFNKIYIKPYTRISPYLIGMLTGYLLYKRKEKNYPRHSLMFMTLGWMLSAGIGLISVFVLYHQNPPLIGNCFYNAFNRTAFGLSLAWVIYACLVGQGGFVNQILSYKFFIPLSRLTYAAYLIHPMIITGYFASMKTSMEFSHISVVYLFLGFLVATYVLSLPVALVLESPIIALEKFIRKSFTKRPESKTVN